MAKYGVEYEGFSSLVLKIENLGVSMNEVAVGSQHIQTARSI